MSKCKYPNDVCVNMIILGGVTYCDSIPCSMKDEIPKPTNYDRIRAMSVEEMAEFLESETYDSAEHEKDWYIKWLNSQAE